MGKREGRRETSEPGTLQNTATLYFTFVMCFYKAVIIWCILHFCVYACTLFTEKLLLDDAGTAS